MPAERQPLLHKNHRARLRKKAIEFGPECLEDHELLELMLFYALPRVDTNELAHEMINRFGSLQNVMNASPAELREVPDIGEKTAVFLSVMNEVSARFLRLSALRKDAVGNIDELLPRIRDFLEKKLTDAFFVCALDSRGALLRCCTIESGGMKNDAGSSYLLRETVKLGGAAYVAVSYSETPSRAPTPEDEDLALSLSRSLKELGLVLWDFFAAHGETVFRMSDYHKKLFPVKRR